MAKRDPTLDALDRLADAARDPDAPASAARLRDALARGVGPVVARAASVVADAGLSPDRSAAGRAAWIAAWTPPLAAAYARLFDTPLRRDRGAHGKTALAAALDRFDHDDPAPFLRGVAYAQWEPVMGGRVDAAARLRARCLAALVRLRHPDRMAWLVDLLWDDWQDARLGAVEAAAFEGTSEAAGLLRAKVLAGDRGADVVKGAPPPTDPGGGADVLGAAFAALLALDAEAHAPFVSRFLAARDGLADAMRERAALALGECRAPAGLRRLADARGAALLSDDKRLLAAGMAANGTDEALALLGAWLRDAGGVEHRLVRATAAAFFGSDSGRLRRLDAMAGEGV